MWKDKLVFIAIAIINIVLYSCNSDDVEWQSHLDLIISEPAYMKECTEINPVQSSKQAGYKNIYPGISKAEDALVLFGKPQVVHMEAFEEGWFYSGFSLGVKADMVLNLHVQNSEDILPLRNYIESYGCPDIILKIEPINSGEGYPGSLEFIYNQIGLQLHFTALKTVTLEDEPTGVFYFPASSLEDFIKSDDLLNNPHLTKPIPWRKAVQ